MAHLKVFVNVQKVVFLIFPAPVYRYSFVPDVATGFRIRTVIFIAHLMMDIVNSKSRSDQK